MRPGLAQLARLSGWAIAHQCITALDDDALAGIVEPTPLKSRGDRINAHHLYFVKLTAGVDRDRAFARLRAEDIGANVHYAMVYLHSYYPSRG